MMSLIARLYSVVSSTIALSVATLLALSAIVTTTQAQVNYYFNPPVGVDTANLVNTWDLPAAGTQFWNSVNQTTPATPSNNYQWTNDTVTNGGEIANFGNTAGTVTLTSNISAYGINFNSSGYAISGGVGNNVLTLYGPGGVINGNVAASITAQINGSVGLTKTGSGALTLNAANSYSGTTTVTGGTLIGNPQVSGSPFSSGAVSLNGSILNLKSNTANTTTTTVGNLTIGAANANTVGASNLTVDNTGGGPTNTTTFAAGNLVRGGSGSALVITPQTGFLGSRENITFSNGGSLLINGILPPWVVTNPTVGSSAADFVTYSTGAPAADYNHNGVVDAGDYVLWRKDPTNNGGGGGYNPWRQTFGATGGGAAGVSVATYSSTDLTTSTNTSVVNQTTVPSITGNVAAYALKTNQAINLNTNTLTLGNGSGQTGLILNAGSITGGNVTFGNTEGMLFAQGTTALGGSGNTITSNGLNVTALGLSNVTLGGNIVNGGGSAFLNITAITSGSSVTLSGANTYTGGTTLSINTSTAGNVFVGSDSAFGIGKVTNIIVPGTSSDQLQASGGDRTLANAFDLNGGMNFTGTNSFTFTGPLTIINSVAGGSRTLGNLITTSGKSVTLGSSGSPSTITLGNPVANGGDGVGKTLGFSANASSTTVINDVMQDPAAGGGTASGSVVFGGSANGVIRLNSQSTYTGTASLNGGSTVQIGADSVGTYPSITSGPFGVGTIVANNATNNPMRPVGGSHTIANPILLTTGFLVSNETTTDPSAGLTFTGPITFTNSRTINNSFTATTGGTLTLGSSGSPSTISLTPTATAQTLTIGGTGTTVVNDAITEPSVMGTNIIMSGAGNATYNGVINTSGLVTISAGGGTAAVPTTTVTLNPLNTYTGGTRLSGAFTIIPIVNSTVGSPGSITSGPFGTGQINFNNGSNQHIRPAGGDRVIANSILLTFGMAMDNGVGESYNLTFSGPVTMTNNRFISNGFIASTTGGSLIMGDPSAASTITLPTLSTFTLSFAALSGPIVVNDVIQDATGQPGNVSFNPNTNNNNPITINGANTYTGTTTFATNGQGQIRISTSTDADFGSINTGPFGKGTVIMANTSATPPPIVPFGANRTVSNAVNLTGNMGAANAGAETFNLNLTGPVTLGSATRSIVNTMAGTLTIGQSTVGASIQPVTLSGVAAQSLTFNGTATSTTVVNDIIQNGGSGLIPGNVTVAGSIVQFNNANTYGPTAGSSTNTTVSGGKLLVNNTSGSGTGTGNVSVTGGVLGGNGTISQSVSLTGGAIAPGNSAGLLTVSGGVTFAGSSAFTVEIGGTSAGVNYDQLVVGGIVDLSAASSSTFNVGLINGYAPPSSPLGTITDFTVLTATGGISGTFGNLAFPDGNWTAIYSANSLVARYIAPGPGSGAVNNLAGGATVPEPTTMALLICAAGSVVLSSSRVSRRRRC